MLAVFRFIQKGALIYPISRHECSLNSIFNGLTIDLCDFFQIFHLIDNILPCYFHLICGQHVSDGLLEVRVPLEDRVQRRGERRRVDSLLLIQLQ